MEYYSMFGWKGDSYYMNSKFVLSIFLFCSSIYFSFLLIFYFVFFVYGRRRLLQIVFQPLELYIIEFFNTWEYVNVVHPFLLIKFFIMFHIFYSSECFFFGFSTNCVFFHFFDFFPLATTNIVNIHSVMHNRRQSEQKKKKRQSSKCVCKK